MVSVYTYRVILSRDTALPTRMHMSDQPAYPCSLIRVFTGHSVGSQGSKAITKTRLYNFDPLKPHFYIVKLRFTGVYIIFLISAQKHRNRLVEAVLTSTHNLCFKQKYESIRNFYLKNFIFFGGKIFNIFEEASFRNGLQADSEVSDQPARMPRLIWVFAGRICNLVG